MVSQADRDSSREVEAEGISQHCRVTPAPGGGRDRMNYEDTLRFLIYGFRRAAWEVLIRSDIEACQLLEQGCKEWSFKAELLQSFCQLLQNEHENCCRAVSYTHLTLPTIYSV